VGICQQQIKFGLVDGFKFQAFTSDLKMTSTVKDFGDKAVFDGDGGRGPVGQTFEPTIITDFPPRFECSLRI
jgi:hypothetical protein